MLYPPVMARIEEGDNCPCLRIAAFKTIATPFVTIAAGQGQVVYCV
jgi:hypothetical protein